MKYWIVAAMFAAACASGAPASQQSSSSQSAPAASSSPDYSDARSSASDAEVRDARRAYRAACQTQQSDAYCECMTGGMAQALPPSELAVATAALTGQSVSASQTVRDHVSALRTDVERGCIQFRRS